MDRDSRKDRKSSSRSDRGESSQGRSGTPRSSDRAKRSYQTSRSRERRQSRSPQRKRGAAASTSGRLQTTPGERRRTAMRQTAEHVHKPSQILSPLSSRRGQSSDRDSVHTRPRSRRTRASRQSSHHSSRSNGQSKRKWTKEGSSKGSRAGTSKPSRTGSIEPGTQETQEDQTTATSKVAGGILTYLTIEQYKEQLTQWSTNAKWRYKTPVDAKPDPDLMDYSDEFILQAECMGATIAQQVTDEELSELAEFDPSVDLIEDLAPVEPIESEGDLHSRVFQLEHYVQVQMHTENFPKEDLKSLIIDRCPLAVRGRSQTMQEVYYRTLLQLYKRYFEARRKLKAGTAQMTASSAAMASSQTTKPTDLELTEAERAQKEDIILTLSEMSDVTTMPESVVLGNHPMEGIVEEVETDADTMRKQTGRFGRMGLRSRSSVRSEDSPIPTPRVDTTPGGDDSSQEVPVQESMKEDDGELLLHPQKGLDEESDSDDEEKESSQSESPPSSDGEDGGKLEEEEVRPTAVTSSTYQVVTEAGPLSRSGGSIASSGTLKVKLKKTSSKEEMDPCPRTFQNPYVLVDPRRIRPPGQERCGIEYAAVNDTNRINNQRRNRSDYYGHRTIGRLNRIESDKLRSGVYLNLFGPGVREMIRPSRNEKEFAAASPGDFFDKDGKEKYPAAAIVAEFAHYGYYVTAAHRAGAYVQEFSGPAVTHAWVRIWDTALTAFRTQVTRDVVLDGLEDEEFLYFPAMPTPDDYKGVHETLRPFVVDSRMFFCLPGKSQVYVDLWRRQKESILPGLERWRINASNMPIGVRSYLQDTKLQFQLPIPTMVHQRATEEEQIRTRTRKGATERGQRTVEPEKVGIKIKISQDKREVRESSSNAAASASASGGSSGQYGKYTHLLVEKFSDEELETRIYRAYLHMDMTLREINHVLDKDYRNFQKLLGDLPGTLTYKWRRWEVDHKVRPTVEQVFQIISDNFYTGDLYPTMRLVLAWAVFVRQLPILEQRDAIALPKDSTFGCLMGVALEFLENHIRKKKNTRQAKDQAKRYYSQVGERLRDYLLDIPHREDWPTAGEEIAEPEPLEDLLSPLRAQANVDRDVQFTVTMKEGAVRRGAHKPGIPPSREFRGANWRTASSQESMDTSGSEAMPPPRADSRGRSTIPRGVLGAWPMRGRGPRPPLRSTSSSTSRRRQSSEEDYDRTKYLGDYYHASGVLPASRMAPGDSRSCTYLGKRYEQSYPTEKRAPKEPSEAKGVDLVPKKGVTGPRKPPDMQQQRQLRLEMKPALSAKRLGHEPQKESSKITIEENWQKAEEAVTLFSWASEPCYAYAFRQHGTDTESTRLRAISGRCADDLSREQSWIREQLPNGRPLETEDGKPRIAMKPPVVPECLRNEYQSQKVNFETHDAHDQTAECVETMYFLKFVEHPLLEQKVTIIDSVELLRGLEHRMAAMTTLAGRKRQYPLIVGFDMEDFTGEPDPNKRNIAMDYGWRGYRPTEWDLDAEGNRRHTHSWQEQWRKEKARYKQEGRTCLNWPKEQWEICPIVFRRCTRVTYGRVIQLFTHDQHQYLIDVFKFFRKTVKNPNRLFLKKARKGSNEPKIPHEYIPIDSTEPGILDPECYSEPTQQLINFLTGAKVTERGMGIVYVTNNCNADFDRLMSTLGVIGTRRPIKEVRDMQAQGQPVISMIDNNEVAMMCGYQNEWTRKPEPEQARQYKTEWSPSDLMIYTFFGTRNLIRAPEEYHRQYGLLPENVKKYDSGRTIATYLEGRPEMLPQDFERPEFHAHRMILHKGELGRLLNVASLKDMSVQALIYAQSDAPMSFAAFVGMLLSRSPEYTTHGRSPTRITSQLRENVKLCAEEITQYFSYPAFFVKRTPDMLTNRQKAKYSKWIKEVLPYLEKAATEEWKIFKRSGYQVWPDLWYNHFTYLVNRIQYHASSYSFPEEETLLRQVCISSFISLWQMKMKAHLRSRVQTALTTGKGIQNMKRRYPGATITRAPATFEFRWMNEAIRVSTLHKYPPTRGMELAAKAQALRQAEPTLEVETDQDAARSGLLEEMDTHAGATSTSAESGLMLDTEDTGSIFLMEDATLSTTQQWKIDIFWERASHPYGCQRSAAATVEEAERRIREVMDNCAEIETYDEADIVNMYGVDETSSLTDRVYLAEVKIWKYGSCLMNTVDRRSPAKKTLLESFLLPTIFEMYLPEVDAKKRQELVTAQFKALIQSQEKEVLLDLRAILLKYARIFSNSAQVEVLGSCFEDFNDFYPLLETHTWVGPAINPRRHSTRRMADGAPYWLEPLPIRS